MANIRISELPLKIGDSGISTGYIPISIGSITYKVNPGQLNIFSLSPNSAVITDGSGQLASSLISSTELFSLENISGNVQTQINNVVASLTAFSKTYVTGGTHNTSAGTTTFTNSTGGTFQVSGYVPFDTYTTGGTYNNPTGTATFTNNSGGTFNVTGFTTGYTYTPEDVANKQNNYTFDGTASKYPTVDAGNNALRSLLKVSARTGLLHKTDNFNMTVLDNSTIRILSADTVYYQFQGLSQPSPLTAIKTFPQRDYPLAQLISGTSGNTNIVPLVADGAYVRYLGLDFSGNVVSQPNNFNDNDNVFQMGYCTVVKSGSNVTFLGGTGATARNVFVKPDMACNTEFDRISTNTTTVTIAGNAAASFKTNPGNAFGISLNFKSPSNPNNTSSIDTFVVTGFTGNTPFVSIDLNFATGTTSGVTTHTLWTELEAGVAINNSFYNTTTKLRDTLNNGAASIKRVLMGFRGGIFVQEGEHAASTAYADLQTARLNIFTQPFGDAIIPGDVVIEIARIAFIKGATDFTNTTQVYIVNTAQSEGGASGGFAPVGDATTSAKGIIQLAGDLAGIATAPTVPGLTTRVSGAGNGISGYTAKWISPSAITVSNIFDTGTNIGIGTTGATYKVQVEPTVVTGATIHNLLKLGVASATANTIGRMAMAVSSNVNDDTGAGKVFLDAIRTANNMDFAISLNDVALGAPIERFRLLGNGNLGLGTSGATSKLHVVGDGLFTDKITYGNSILTTNNLQFEKHLGQYTFSAGTANQNIDIILGNNDIVGHIEVTLTSTFQGGNALGSIVKVFQVGVTPNNNIFQNQGNVVEASTATTGHFAIGDLFWDSFFSRYAIRLSHLSSSLNTISVSVKFYNGGPTPNALNVFNSVAFGSEYIQTGATKNYITFSDNIYITGTTTSAGFIVSGGSPTQVLKADGNLATINGTTNNIAKFSGTSDLINSNIIDNGTVINLTTNALVNGRTLGSGNGNDPGNTAFGVNVLQSVTTSFNTAIGWEALKPLTTGGFSTAIGGRCLRNTTTGTQNTAIGADSLINNISGSENVAIGYFAGAVISSGLGNSTGLKNTFIGANTRPLNNGDSNSTLIGYGTFGRGGSNTMTFGDLNITDNYFRGLLHTTTGYAVDGATSSQFLKGNGTLDSTVYANNANVLHTSGDESFTGTKSSTVAGTRVFDLTNNGNQNAIGITNNNIGGGLFVNNSTSSSSTAIGVTVNNGGSNTTGVRLINYNNNTGNLIYIDNGAGSTGKPLSVNHGGNEVAYINYTGGVVSQAFIKSGATSSDFLKGNGDIDSTLYVNNSRTVRNQSGVTLSAGTIVEINSISGGIPNVSKANANAFIGGQLLIINETIANNATGIAVITGQYIFDTSSFAPNDNLYVGLDGGFQNNTTGLVAIINIGKVLTSAGSGTVVLDTRTFDVYLQAFNFNNTTDQNEAFADLNMMNNDIISANTINTLTVGRGGGNNPFNTAVGLSALANQTTGNSNTAIGRFTLNASVTGFSNTAVGHQSMQTFINGGSNVAVGSFSMQQTIGGNSNVAVGNTALFQNQGSENVGVGGSALANSSGGNNNTAVGAAALLGLGSFVTSGNTALGWNAGRFVITGTTQNSATTQSTFIGADTRGTVNGVNELVIGFSASGTGSNTTVIGTPSTTGATVYGNTKIVGALTANTYATPSGAFNQALIADGTVRTLQDGSFSGGITISPTGTTAPTVNNGVFTRIGDTVTANLGFSFSVTATTATTYTITVPLPVVRGDSTQRFIGQANFEGGLTRVGSVLNSTTTSDGTILFSKTIGGTEAVLVNVTYQYNVLI